MRKTAIKLIDIIGILSDNHKIKIGVDGTYCGTFNKNEITYEYMQLFVKSIWVYRVNNDEIDDIYLCLDLG